MNSRLKQTLVLTPGVYLLVLWVLFLSDSSILTQFGIYSLAVWGLLLSFGSAYSITLYLSMRNEKK